MRELVARTCLALARMRFWKPVEIHHSTGRIDSTTSASCQFITSMLMLIPIIIVPPQMRSRKPQARMLDNRSQSDVIRAMSQPTGRWS